MTLAAPVIIYLSLVASACFNFLYMFLAKTFLSTLFKVLTSCIHGGDEVLCVCMLMHASDNIILRLSKPAQF